MKLYHSSTVAVSSPDTLHSRDYLDFGKGFYLTSIYDQAVSMPSVLFAETVKRGLTAMNLIVIWADGNCCNLIHTIENGCNLLPSVEPERMTRITTS